MYQTWQQTGQKGAHALFFFVYRSPTARLSVVQYFFHRSDIRETHKCIVGVVNTGA